MVNILKSGRLGNNLFQFAFGLILSKKLKTGFIFNTDSLGVFFELGRYNNFFLKKARYISYLLSLKFNKWKPLDLNLDKKPDEILNMVQNHTIIYGYFQSENYFKDDRALVRKYFKIKNRHIKNFHTKYGELFQKQTVCIAIRLTDYSNWKIDEIDGNTPELSFDYFNKLIDKTDDIVSKNVIFISDDIVSVRANIKYKNATYITGEIDQLIALSLADELIISNSSFHWWGAWLNQKPNKMVYAPEFWLGHKVNREYPKEIIPKDWRQITVQS